MRNFFIDLENVKSQGLNGIINLNKTDNVYVFYSDNVNTLTIPTFQAISESKANVEYIKLNATGHNAMDFQIVAMIGMMLGNKKKGEYYIVSNDMGYIAAIAFFNESYKDSDVTVRKIDTIARVEKYRAADGKTEEIKEEEDKEVETVDEILHKILSTELCDMYGELVEKSLSYSRNKNEFYQYFRKRLGQEKGGELYKKLKNEYDRLKSIVGESEELEERLV